MKKLICFFMLILVFVSAAFAQTGDVSTGTDYDSMIATFAGFAGCVVLLTEGIKALFPKMNGLLTSLSVGVSVWRPPCCYGGLMPDSYRTSNGISPCFTV